jgi:chromosome segregation ATPase
MTDVWEKIKKWFQRNWPHVLSFGLTFLIGFIVGRVRRGGASEDFIKLREHNRRLADELEQVRSRAEELAKLNDERRGELEQLEIKLSTARRSADIAAEELGNSTDGVESLKRTNQELRRFLLKYGEQLKHLENGDNNDSGS